MVVVADQPQAVAPGGDRGVFANVPGAVQGVDAGAGAGGVAAVGDFQIVVGVVVVADQPQAVASNGDRCVFANVPGAVDDCAGKNRDSRLALHCAVGVDRLDHGAHGAGAADSRLVVTARLPIQRSSVPCFAGVQGVGRRSERLPPQRRVTAAACRAAHVHLQPARLAVESRRPEFSAGVDQGGEIAFVHGGARRRAVGAKLAAIQIGVPQAEEKIAGAVDGRPAAVVEAPLVGEGAASQCRWAARSEQGLLWCAALRSVPYRSQRNDCQQDCQAGPQRTARPGVKMEIIGHVCAPWWMKKSFWGYLVYILQGRGKMQ